MLPNFVIIGAQKAGSTFLDECIKEHPCVYMPRYETPFFEDPEYDENGLSNLEACFAKVNRHKLIGIKRPDYLGRPECPERIAQHLPNAKLIVVLREPVARAVSAYFWYLQVGILPIMPLNDGMRRLLDGEYASDFPKSREILDYGRYGQHLRRYLKYFDRNQMLILLHEEVRGTPRIAIVEAYRFLGLDETYEPRALTRNPKESVYSLPRLRWLAFANRHFFYNHHLYGQGLVALHRKTRTGARSVYNGLVAIDRLALAHLYGNPKPKLAPTLRAKMEQFYADDVQELEALLKRKLDSWHTGTFHAS